MKTFFIRYKPANDDGAPVFIAIYKAQCAEHAQMKFDDSNFGEWEQLSKPMLFNKYMSV